MRMAVQMDNLSPLKALEFRVMEVESVARYHHHSLAARRIAWESWVRWCAEQRRHENQTEPTVVAFPRWLALEQGGCDPVRRCTSRC